MCSSDLFQTSVAVCEQAERLLLPLKDTPEIRAKVLRTLATVLDRKAYGVMRTGRSKEAIPIYQQAITHAEEADRLAPSRRPGLQAASIMPWLGEAFSRSNRPNEARQMTEISRGRLEKFVADEPFLMTARRQLAYATSWAAVEAFEQWDFAKATRIRDEYRAVYKEMLKLDSRNNTYINNVGLSFIGAAMTDMLQGNFAEAEQNHREAIATFSVDWATTFMKGNASAQHAQLGLLYAATGRDAEAVEQTTLMYAAMKPAMEQMAPESREREIRQEVLRHREREIGRAHV